MEIQTLGRQRETFAQDTEFVKIAQTRRLKHDYVLSEKAITAAEVERRIVCLGVQASHCWSSRSKVSSID
jgi:hypothetical protein